jgi:TldD protein
MNRRDFLTMVGCGCGGLAAHMAIPGEGAAGASDLYATFDRAAQLNLADSALRLAKLAGASYADIRIGRTEYEALHAREERLENFRSSFSSGFGMRVLLDGSWGFAGSTFLDEAEIARVVALALGNAKAAHLIQTTPILVEDIPAYQEDWTMPMRIDPFSISVEEKSAKLLAINAAALKAGANFVTSAIDIAREEKFFVSSRGSRICQSRVRIFPHLEVTAVDKETRKFATRETLAPPRGAGWEHILDFDFEAEAALAAEQARQKLAAKPVVPGPCDLVLDPGNLWLTIHESIGHSTELDRALGWEANFAGTSFVTPDKLGKLKFGNPLLNVIADRSQEGGLATVGFDDDGVKSAGAEFPIIENGIFKNYQTAIGQAQLIGGARSNGCAYADSPTRFPIQRMPNISLQPNPAKSSLDDLIGDVKDGIYIVGAGSWSIDQQRYNFQFGGQLFYEIRNGKRGEMLRDVTYQATTTDFWNSLDGLGDRSTYVLGGSFYCGKGQPPQIAPVSHGAVPARFRQINVLNTERKDI